MRRRKPPILRAASALRVLAVLGLVMFVAFLATAGYSAARIRPGGVSAPGTTIALVGNDTAVLNGSFSLANPGFYAISGLSVRVAAFLPSGFEAASGRSGNVTVPSGSNVTVPVSLVLSIASGVAASVLLTEDTVLPTQVWVNATYAYLFAIAVHSSTNVTWGAPFYGLRANASTPVLLSNGSARVNVTLSFENHAAFPVAGELLAQLRSAAGSPCGGTRLPITVASGSAFHQGFAVTTSPGCDPSGGELLLSLVAPTFTLNLPPERLP